MVSCRAASGTLLCCAQTKVLAPIMLSIMNRFFLIMVLVLVIVICYSPSHKSQIDFRRGKSTQNNYNLDLDYRHSRVHASFFIWAFRRA